MKKSLEKWYDHVPESMRPKYHNPAIKNHGITLPFRMIIVGNSGSGKTTLVLELLHRMKDTFGHVTVCCANSDEPLYKYLASKLDAENLTIVEGYENIPDIDSLEKDTQHLIVFDDLCLEKDQRRISEYFIRGRKISGGVSCIYLTQSYFAVPKVIRLQASYIILKKLSSLRDLNLVIKDFNLDKSKEEMLAMYQHCTAEPLSFLMVDINVAPEQRFRKNFLQCIS